MSEVDSLFTSFKKKVIEAQNESCELAAHIAYTRLMTALYKKLRHIPEAIEILNEMWEDV